MAATQNGRKALESFDVRILRQDGPGQPSYWERHRVAYQPDMNVISVLQTIAAEAKTADGKDVAPVVWDCNCLEEVCGACTMVVNGRVRQACSALVDRLLEEQPGEIELRPATQVPRDSRSDGRSQSTVPCAQDRRAPGSTSTATMTWGPGRCSRRPIRNSSIR